jgi:hypothetical protein
MDSPARELARRLGECAEAVCRRYLAAGRKEGRYWLVGDVRNAPGQSLYVRLSTSADGRGAAGKWTDAHTGEHGDLLDIIAVASGHHSMRETLEEARRFLSLPQVDTHVQNARTAKARPGTTEAALRLWAASKPIERTVVSRYLEGRALVSAGHGQALRFHPSCYYRPSRRDSPDTPRAWPAMIAAVTDLHGAITGVHRTWLEPATCTKAQITNPRRAMGGLLGNGVRFGLAGPVMVAAEGIETTLSLRQVLPDLPMISCLSAAHLAAVHFPPVLRRLYVGLDNDTAGETAVATLHHRVAGTGIEIVALKPCRDDFNTDLRVDGAEQLTMALREQLVGEDAAAFLRP